MDIQRVRINVIDRSGYHHQEKTALEDFYLHVIQLMRKEGKIDKGHVSFVQEILMELSYLHQMLLYITKDPRYKGLFEKCASEIEFLHQKNPLNKSDIEVILEAFYGRIVLRLSGKKISEETAESLKKMSDLMDYLAKEYKKLKEQSA